MRVEEARTERKDVQPHKNLRQIKIEGCLAPSSQK